MIYPKPRRVNVRRMEKYRQRFWPHYLVQYVDRDFLVSGGMDLNTRLRFEFVTKFRQQMLAHHMYDKHKWGKGIDIILSDEYDIDYNRYKWIIEEQFHPKELTK